MTSGHLHYLLDTAHPCFGLNSKGGRYYTKAPARLHLQRRPERTPGLGQWTPVSSLLTRTLGYLGPPATWCLLL